MPSPSERYAAARRRSERPALHSFRGEYPFALDDFQLRACEALEDGYAVLVCAPTGAGKTVVGEFAVHLALASGQKCFYTTPIKALSNQKYNDLVDRHGPEQVGLLTGDNSVNADAPIVVMTTEVLRNMLYVGSMSLTDLGYVVLDEVHYLGDRFRGGVWEEVIIHLPASVRMVSLSATVSNAEEFGEWLVSVRGETRVIVHEERPVPLWQHMLVGRRMFDLFAGDGTGVDPALTRYVNDRLRTVDPGAFSRRGGPRGLRGWRPLPRPDVIARLDAEGLLPAITFIFSRAGCDAAVRQCVHAGLWLTDDDERAEIDALIDERTAAIAREDLEVLGYWDWRDGLRRGFAAHHAGLVPPFKETVEELFVRGLVKAVFATETLALGINMPARTVRAGAAEQVQRRDARRPDAGGVHPAHRPGRAARHRHRGPRRRAVESRGRSGPGRRARLDAHLPAALVVSPVLQHGRQPRRADGPPGRRGTCSSPRSRSSRPTAGWPGWCARSAATRRRLREYATQMTCDRGDLTEYAALRRELTERERELSRQGARERKAAIVAVAGGAASGRRDPGAVGPPGRARGRARSGAAPARRPAAAGGDRRPVGRTGVAGRVPGDRRGARDGAGAQERQSPLAAGAP